MGWSEYKNYTDKFAELTNIYYELIYLCDNFDIKRLDKFIIDIIENYDFFILEDENSESGDGYSNLDDHVKLSKDILKSYEYIKMIEYINENFSKIYEKYTLFINKIDNLTSIYLEDVKQVNISIIENFKSEYNDVILKLELLEQKLSLIPNKKFKVDETKRNLNLDVLLISNKTIIYGISYNFFKKYFYKNLHVIYTAETYDITISEQRDFNMKINKIYLNVYKEFIKTLINGKAIKFNEEFIKDLNEKIQNYKGESNNIEERTSQLISEKKEEKRLEDDNTKLEKEEALQKKEAKTKDTLETINTKKKESIEKQRENYKKGQQESKILDEGIKTLKENIKESEPEANSDLDSDVGSRYGSDNEPELESEYKPELKSEYKPEPKYEHESNPQKNMLDENNPLVKQLIGQLIGFTNIATSPTAGTLGLEPNLHEIYIQHKDYFDNRFNSIKHLIKLKHNANSSPSAQPPQQYSQQPQQYSQQPQQPQKPQQPQQPQKPQQPQQYSQPPQPPQPSQQSQQPQQPRQSPQKRYFFLSRNNIRQYQRNIPDIIWKRINDYGIPMTKQYNEREAIIELWNKKYTDEKNNIARWEKEEATDPEKVKREREKYYKEEKKKKEYWDKYKKKDLSGLSLGDEIRYIGEIPPWLNQFQDSWTNTSAEYGERAALSTGLEDVPNLSAAEQLENQIRDDSFKTSGTYYTYDGKRTYRNWGDYAEVILPSPSSAQPSTNNRQGATWFGGKRTYENWGDNKEVILPSPSSAQPQSAPLQGGKKDKREKKKDKREKGKEKKEKEKDKKEKGKDKRKKEKDKRKKGKREERKDREKRE